MDLNAVQWFEDVPTTSRKSKMTEFVELLKSRPGMWALYSASYKNGASANSFKKRFPGTDWKSRRNEGEKTFSIYARWSPSTEEPTAQ